MGRFGVVDVYCPLPRGGCVRNLVGVGNTGNLVGSCPFRGQLMGPLKGGGRDPDGVPHLVGVRMGGRFGRG